MELNRLRNQFAHKHNVVANLQTVLQQLPAKYRQSTPESLGVYLLPRRQNEDRLQDRLRGADMTRRYPRPVIFLSARCAFEMLASIYYDKRGKDGQAYAEDFRPQLQDLLHDPAVIEFKRDFAGWWVREIGHFKEDES